MTIWHCLPVGVDSQDIRFNKRSADAPYRIPGRKFMQGVLIVLTLYSWDTNTRDMRMVIIYEAGCQLGPYRAFQLTFEFTRPPFVRQLTWGGFVWSPEQE